jgi:hypothetical protein
MPRRVRDQCHRVHEGYVISQFCTQARVRIPEQLQVSENKQSIDSTCVHHRPAHLYLLSITGAKVRLECKHFGTGVLERTIDGVTDETGTYKIELKGSHVEDICEVVLVQSPRANCAEPQPPRDRARVVLTSDGGICDGLRLANALGYFKDVPLPVCGALLKQFDLADDDQ